MINSDKQKAILDKIFIELDMIGHDKYIEKIGPSVFHTTISLLSTNIANIDYRDIIVDFTDNGIHFTLSLNGNRLLMIDSIFNYCDDVNNVFFSLFIDRKLKNSGCLHIEDMNEILKNG